MNSLKINGVNNKMKHFLSIFIILFATHSQAENQDTIHEMELNSPAEVKEWCKNKSLQYFIEKQKNPDNWSATSWMENNIININGLWIADNIEYTVKCRVRQGLKEKHAFITIDEKSTAKDNNKIIY